MSRIVLPITEYKRLKALPWDQAMEAGAERFERLRAAMKRAAPPKPGRPRTPRTPGNKKCPDCQRYGHLPFECNGPLMIRQAPSYK